MDNERKKNSSIIQKKSRILDSGFFTKYLVSLLTYNTDIV